MKMRGSCLCRKVRYEIDGELTLPGNCHCSMCRKAHGAAFGSFAGTARSGFRWLEGEELVTRYESSPGGFRCFCSRCGSQLISESTAAPDQIFVALGPLDDDPGVRPIAHVFVGSKAPWHEITDDLMKFDAWPPGMGPAKERS